MAAVRPLHPPGGSLQSLIRLVRCVGHHAVSTAATNVGGDDYNSRAGIGYHLPRMFTHRSTRFGQLIMMRFPILLSAFLFVVPTFAAETINVTDHGVVPGKDVTYSLNRLIESVRDKADITLVFPAGQYEFYPENGVEMHRAVSNHDNSLKRIAFPLLGCKNITVDGGGATFMFHGRISPFVLDGVNGATLKNFSIDWSRSFHDELPVVERDETDGSFVVEIDPDKYPHVITHGSLFSQKDDWQDPMGSNIVFDPKTRAPIFNTRDYSVNFFRPHKATPAGKNRVKIEASVRKSPPPVGSVLISYGRHPTSRLCPAIHLANSREIKIEDVTIYDAGGMGVIAEHTENIHLDRLTVTSTEERLVTTRADATHFIGCKGTIRMENCLFEHMLDDGINVHGAYIKVEEYLGNHEFLCEISHFQQWGLTFADPGDKIALISRETVLPFFETTITKTRVLNERRLVVTVADMPLKLPQGPLSIENLTWYPDLIMRKNIIRENRARGALITTKGKVIVEDNVFSNQMHGILIEGDNNKWYESGGVEDITIQNNVFENVGFAGDAAYPLLASPLLKSGQRMGAGHYHRNIRFVNNTLKSFNGNIVHARSVQGLDVSGNKMEFSRDYPEVKDFPAIRLEYCDDVTIADNKASGFDRPLALETSADCTEVTMKNNDGFERKAVDAKQGKTRKAAAATKPHPAGKKPNIVLLFVDDLGWSDLGYRNPKFESPNVDKLVAEGLDFQQAYISCPTCSPSRATLLTGKHPARLQIVRHVPNDEKHGFDKFGRTDKEFNLWGTDPAKFPCRNWLPLEHTTYAEALGDLGYYNQFVGKWHLGHEPYHPIHQGFDAQFGTSNAGHPKSYYPPFFKNSEVLAEEKEAYLTDRLTDASVEFIETYDRDQPFMLSMWYYNVHRPPVGRKDLVKHFTDKGHSKVDAVYAAQVKAMDESVGRIRAAIANRGIADDTIVIFLSDQGGIFDNPPFRGGKRVDTLCEGGARVPMVVHWPGVTKPGSQNNSVVQSTDWFPTLVEIAGGDATKFVDLDGVSLIPTIKNNQPPQREQPVIGYRAYEDLYASVRDGDWKLLAYRSGKVSLYNLANDIAEQNDLASGESARVRAMTTTLAEWEKKMNVQQYSGIQENGEERRVKKSD